MPNLKLFEKIGKIFKNRRKNFFKFEENQKILKNLQKNQAVFANFSAVAPVIPQFSTEMGLKGAKILEEFYEN